MDLDTQGVTQASPSAVPQERGGQPVPSATVDPNIQQFVVEPSATQDGGQGGTPSATPTQVQGVPTQTATDELARQLQAEKDRVYAQNLALQSQLQLMQQQQNQFMQQFQTQQAPPDPTTDPVGALKWEIRESQKTILQEVEKRQQVQLQSMLAGAAEMQWKNAHPNVDAEAVKAFNRMNGIAEWNLDAGHKLMTMPSQVHQVAQQAINQTFQQFRQPQNGASPIRNAQSTSQNQTQLSWEKMAQAYNANPSIENSWSPELRDFFWKGTRQLEQNL